MLLQKYVAAETGDPLADIASESINSFVRQNYSNFDVSRQTDQDDILVGGLGNDCSGQVKLATVL